jgi:hypothetical protein
MFSQSVKQNVVNALGYSMHVFPRSYHLSPLSNELFFIPSAVCVGDGDVIVHLQAHVRSISRCVTRDLSPQQTMYFEYFHLARQSSYSRRFPLRKLLSNGEMCTELATKMAEGKYAQFSLMSLNDNNSFSFTVDLCCSQFLLQLNSLGSMRLCSRQTSDSAHEGFVTRFCRYVRPHTEYEFHF